MRPDAPADVETEMAEEEGSEMAGPVRISGEATLRAVTYYATHKDPSLRPYHWYKEYVLAGARENSLPVEHIKVIESIASVEDPDAPRTARAQAILHSK
jgi:hypothetical protein